MAERLRRARARRYPGCAVAVVTGVLAYAHPGHARMRPLFEPTDLEMEEPGLAELDLQVGAIRGRGPWRAVLPDFEIDLGLLPNLELDLDGAYAIEGPDMGPFSFDHAAPDSLFPSLKLGLLDDADPGPGLAVAAGLQLGPKLPVAAGSHGLGFEALALGGVAWRGLHAALNVGGFIDPAADAATAAPKGIELGLDVDLKLDSSGQFALTAEASGVRFVSSDPDQLLTTAGVTWSVTERLDLSLVGLLGVLEGSDRYGLLLGLSPKFRVFHAARRA